MAHSTHRVRSAKRVLVVARESTEADVGVAAVQAIGFVPTGIATTKDEALRKAELDRPDIVLMDIHGSRPADEIETASAITARFHIPVVFVTSNSDVRTIQRVIDAHPYGCLAKPFDSTALLATLQLALQRHQDELSLRREYAEKQALLEQRNETLSALAGQLLEESTHDALTGLYNRRHLDRVMERELSLARREHRHVGVILLDLDHFKGFNDRFGHAAGDSALRAVAEFLRSRLRAHDVVCRYGGEEIAIVLSGARALQASLLAEQLRAGIEQLSIEHAGTALPGITATFGVASYPLNGADPAELLEAADAALYVAKAKGRNGVSVAPPTRPADVREREPETGEAEID